MPNLTDIKPVDIISYIEQNFSRTQAKALNCLLFLALREQTSVADKYQEQKTIFNNIPEQIIIWCNALEDNELQKLRDQITDGLLEEFISNAQ